MIFTRIKASFLMMALLLRHVRTLARFPREVLRLVGTPPFIARNNKFINGHRGALIPIWFLHFVICSFYSINLVATIHPTNDGEYVDAKLCFSLSFAFKDKLNSQVLTHENECCVWSNLSNDIGKENCLDYSQRYNPERMCFMLIMHSH